MATSKALPRLLTAASRANQGSIRACGSFLNVEIKRYSIDMAIDCHTGDGAKILQPIELTRSQEIRRPDLNSLKDLVQDNDVEKVLVSWPVQDGSGRILQSLDSVLKDSCDVVKTSRPFYMLDGGGRKMGSLCLVKPSKPSHHWNTTLGPHTIDELNTAQKIHGYQMDGSWLKAYSTSRVAHS